MPFSKFMKRPQTQISRWYHEPLQSY